MAEGTYEYECMRAELLGLDKPDYEEYLKKREEREKERIENEEEEIEEKNIEELENQNEQMKNATGGLEELNNILSVTQKKLHRFKSACGSLTNLLKLKVGHSSTESLPKEENGVSEAQTHNGVNKEISIEISSPETTEKQVLNGQRKKDLAKALDNSLDKLDSMLEKAESAQYSMAHQNKQMKGYLNK